MVSKPVKNILVFFEKFMIYFSGEAGSAARRVRYTIFMCEFLYFS